MKKLFILLLIPATVLVFAFRVPNPAVMEFEDLKHNFGFIHQGDIVSHDFVFTNNGDEPVIIQDAEVTCTCTKVDYPKQPIAKGQKGTIKVTFDSKSAYDRQERTVLVKSNAQNAPVTLTFKAVVLKPKN
jgi:hypothetical protein